MKRIKFNPSWVVTASLVCWGIALLLMLVGPSLTGVNGSLLTLLMFIIMIAGVLTVGSAIILIFGMSARSPISQVASRGRLVKVVAAMVVVAIVISTAAAMKSFWYSPLSHNFGDRFVYENLATGVGFASLVLTILLSALQKDMYWATRNNTVALDERQLTQRREVFEISYKLGTVIVLVAMWWLNGRIHNIPAILANNYGSVPHHLYWLGINLAVALFALPLIVAAWKDK